MPIPFLAGQVFDDGAVAAMGIAFDRACRAFDLVDKDDAVASVLAQKIIEAAREGERDPDKLYKAVQHWATRRDVPARPGSGRRVKAGERST